MWLHHQGLSKRPTGVLDVLGTIKSLGFVQLDTIQYVARAHHHILWSRNQNYREHMLDDLLGRDRTVFEHFTHDASVIPMEFLPFWARQFQRKKDRMDRPGYYKIRPSDDLFKSIKTRITHEGPLSTHAFDTKIEGPKVMWARPPHKLALDYLWYCGELATCHRRNFTKFYDLAERVFPIDISKDAAPDHVQIDWLCRGALDRLGFGSQGDIQRFWEATSRNEVGRWAADAPDLTHVDVQTAQGDWIPLLAPSNIEARMHATPAPTSRLRILNPFDPATRDRDRLSRLFGFEYKIEMFVPAAKRKWGYYVFPILEGDRFVGRIDVKADRASDELIVTKMWPEAGVAWPQSRWDKLHAELERLKRFAGVAQVRWIA